MHDKDRGVGCLSKQGRHLAPGHAGDQDFDAAVDALTIALRLVGQAAASQGEALIALVDVAAAQDLELAAFAVGGDDDVGVDAHRLAAIAERQGLVQLKRRQTLVMADRAEGANLAALDARIVEKLAADPDRAAGAQTQRHAR